jgi:HPt (histidine-containing phosphotransfer) domain-containing protein
MDDFTPKPTTIPALAAKLRLLLPHLTWSTSTPGDLDPPGAVADGPGDGIDPAVLAELTGGDPETAAAVVEEYLASCRDELKVLNEVVRNRQAEQARRLAHRIVGASRVVGASSVASVAALLEASAGEEPAWTELEDRVVDLRDTLEDVARHLTAERP